MEELAASRKKLAVEAERQRTEVAALEAEIEGLHAKLQALDEGAGGKVGRDAAPWCRVQRTV